MSETVKVKYVNIDSWNRPIFKDVDSKKYYGTTDILFPYEESERSVSTKVKASDLVYFGSHFDCEPWGSPVENLEIVWGFNPEEKEPEKTSPKFDYMMMDRLRMDAEYWLGYGNRCNKRLYYQNPTTHYEEMEKLWNSLEPKPEWLTKDELEKYKKLLLENKK